jgi:hypothetical protein
MEILVNAYLHWAANGLPLEDSSNLEGWEFTVVSFEGINTFTAKTMKFDYYCAQSTRYKHFAMVQVLSA